MWGINKCKTTYIKRLATGEFQKDYVPTNGTIVTPLSLDSNVGKVTFHVYDGGYPAIVHGAIIMCDTTNAKSLGRLTHYYHWAQSLFGSVPVILCGSKTDLQNREIRNEEIGQIVRDLRKCYGFFDISSKTGYDFKKPLLHLLRRLPTLIRHRW